MADPLNYFGFDSRRFQEVAIVNGVKVASCDAGLPQEARTLFWSGVLLRMPPNIAAHWLIAVSAPRSTEIPE